jgi:hypothetical protein
MHLRLLGLGRDTVWRIATPEGEVARLNRKITTSKPPMKAEMIGAI